MALLTSQTELTSIADGDFLHVVDVSDITDSSLGTSKKITKTNLLSGHTHLLATGATDITASVADVNATTNFEQTLSSSTTVLTVTDGVIDFDIASHDGTNGLKLGGTLVTSTAAELNILDGATLTVTELNYVDGVTSAIQTQIDAKGVGDMTIATYDAATVNEQLVGLTASQELTNKTHDGDFKLKNATDNIQVNSLDPYRTITITPGFLKPTTTAGCAEVTTVEAGTNDIDYDVLDFDTTTDENVFVNFQMSDSWDAGTIQFRYIWTTAAGGAAETVTFELSGRSYADNDAIDQAVGTAIEVADTWIANGDIHTSAWSGNVTLSGTPAAGEWVHLELMRDVSQDNLGGDARLIALQVRYRQATYSD